MTVNELIEELQKLKQLKGYKVGDAFVLIAQIDINENGKAIGLEFEEKEHYGGKDVVWIMCEDRFG